MSCRIGGPPLSRGFFEACDQRATGVSVRHASRPHGRQCSFEAILHKYDLAGNPVLALLRTIVNGMDTNNAPLNQPEGPGLAAIAEGFRHRGYGDDRAVTAAEWIAYAALYAYCQARARQGRDNGAFKA